MRNILYRSTAVIMAAAICIALVLPAYAASTEDERDRNNATLPVATCRDWGDESVVAAMQFDGNYTWMTSDLKSCKSFKDGAFRFYDQCNKRSYKVTLSGVRDGNHIVFHLKFWRGNSYLSPTDYSLISDTSYSWSGMPVIDSYTNGTVSSSFHGWSSVPGVDLANSDTYNVGSDLYSYFSPVVMSGTNCHIYVGVIERFPSASGVTSPTVIHLVKDDFLYDNYYHFWVGKTFGSVDCYYSNYFQIPDMQLTTMTVSNLNNYLQSYSFDAGIVYSAKNKPIDYSSIGKSASSFASGMKGADMNVGDASDSVTATTASDTSDGEKTRGVLGSLTESIKNWFNNLFSNIHNMNVSIGSWFSTLGDNIGSWFSTLSSNIRLFFSDLASGIKVMFSDFWSSLWGDEFTAPDGTVTNLQAYLDAESKLPTVSMDDFMNTMTIDTSEYTSALSLDSHLMSDTISAMDIGGLITFALVIGLAVYIIGRGVA